MATISSPATESPAAADTTESRILRAAAGLFRSQGFAGTTVRQIAKASDLLPGSLHYRYRSKESILLALMEWAVEIGVGLLQKAIETGRSPLERIQLALRDHLALMRTDADVLYVLLYEWRALTGEARDAIIVLRDRYERCWEHLIADVGSTLPVRPGVDLKMVRLLAFGAMGWVPQWFRMTGERSPEEIADALIEYLCRGVLVDTPQLLLEAVPKGAQ